MPVDKIINDLVKSVVGCKGVAVVGYDGIGIDWTVTSEGDEKTIENAMASAADGMRAAKNLIEEYHAGELYEMIVTSERTIIYLTPISEDYWLGVTLTADANLGKARVEVKKVLPKIGKEL